MDDGEVLREHLTTGHSFSDDELHEYASRFSEHELFGVDLGPARQPAADE